MRTKADGEGVFAHWPNRITMIRFVGALVLFAIFAVFGDVTFPAPDVEGAPSRAPFLIAFVLFTLIAATDFLDGYLARREGVVTAFGRIADPFTDKVLILGTMIYLANMPWSERWMPASIVVVILAREFLVTGIRGYVESLGREFPADGFGKIKMIVQSVAVGGIIWMEAFPWGAWWHSLWSAVVTTLVALTLITTVGSGVTYVLKVRTILAEVDA